MSEHDDRRDHDAKADELESELDELQEHSDKLGEEIDSAGEEWERRKADDRVPTAAGEQPDDDSDEDGGDGGELDFGKSLAEGGDERDEGA